MAFLTRRPEATQKLKQFVVIVPLLTAMPRGRNFPGIFTYQVYFECFLAAVTFTLRSFVVITAACSFFKISVSFLAFFLVYEITFLPEKKTLVILPFNTRMEF